MFVDDLKVYASEENGLKESLKVVESHRCHRYESGCSELCHSLP